ncbi:chemotaxis protein [Rhizobacter sp. AJA081-3]|uniref:methyl-accepting chemotaxis protein n=1 Tax=Rhizobacter sp. AJA081-3 TaxID=2753607 RepID=UPI001ADFFB3B|nr:methyl-accepting chemotaxis protein [Rhizobacter sp. AJA081-3]QTN22780.1 chemotaxis protein [Rhizobacter sp. AJA081-3]
MRFSTRLLLCSVIPAALFVTALTASLWGLFRTQHEFDRYLGTEQARANGMNEMYAQGLQMGQALRNIVLDPKNGKAYDNFAGAAEAYAKAQRDTAALAGGTALATSLEQLATLREVQSAKQARVIELVKTDPAAAAQALTAEETPAWRNLRARLLEEIAKGRQEAQVAHQNTQQRAQQLTLLSLALAGFAVIVAGALTALLAKTVQRELGVDPAQAREALRHIADGDLTAPTTAPHEMRGLMAELERTRDRLNSLVDGVRRSTDSITTASVEIATGNQDLSARTEQTASNLQQTASAMEELTATVRQSADSARQANQLAASAAEVAQRGGTVVSQVVFTMDEINTSSKKISDIIGVIDGIAFQTNILALNAAVEAARAGEQGRGFAVVASEVRSLAQRSAEAAKEIKGLIGASVERVEAGSRLVADAGQTMGEIVGSVQRVSDIIGEITAAAAEQSDGIGQVNTAVTQLDQMTQQNAALVEQSAAAAESLKDQTLQLARVVSVFRTVG